MSKKYIHAVSEG